MTAGNVVSPFFDSLLVKVSQLAALRTATALEVRQTRWYATLTACWSRCALKYKVHLSVVPHFGPLENSFLTSAARCQVYARTSCIVAMQYFMAAILHRSYCCVCFRYQLSCGCSLLSAASLSAAEG